MYDARNDNRFSASGDALFFVVVVVVVAAAFFAGFAAPRMLSSDDAERVVSASDSGDALSGSLAKAFRDKRTRNYLAALKDYDARSYAELEQRVASAGDKAARRDAILQHSADIMIDNQRDISRSDVRYFDNMLTLAQRGLRQASSGRSRFCKGAFYQGVEAMSEREMRRLSTQLAASDEIYEYSIDFMKVVVDAASDGRTNPKRYGALNSTDEAAMQGLVFSLMGDQEIMKAMMAAQRGGSAALNDLDICKIGGTLVSAVKTLPQATKGRLWAQAMSGDMKDLSRYGAR